MAQEYYIFMFKRFLKLCSYSSWLMDMLYNMKWVRLVIYCRDFLLRILFLLQLALLFCFSSCLVILDWALSLLFWVRILSAVSTRAGYTFLRTHFIIKLSCVNYDEKVRHQDGSGLCHLSKQSFSHWRENRRVRGVKLEFSGVNIYCLRSKPVTPIVGR